MTNYPTHPGYGADCPLQEIVNAHPLGTSSNGYRCGWTGGHCLPGDACASYCYEAGKQAGRELRLQAEAARIDQVLLEGARQISRIVRS